MKDPPKNVVASVLARLRNVADKAGLTFNDALQSYVIERFLARLAQSQHADSVLLKGALLLRVWGVPRARPTMDIDLLRRGDADTASLVQLVAVVDEKSSLRHPEGSSPRTPRRAPHGFAASSLKERRSTAPARPDAGQ